ncbi:MAG: pyridoxine 5'-phosphate synthase [Desulfobacterales bacterium]|nr:pyridoxine 5'-phosphate synthase [Desulfobacterales bacterium]
MAGLAVNVDHVATLRQARQVLYPDPVAAAIQAELAGCDGIVVHLREDRRHIQDRDVRILRQIVQTKLILEMAATSEMIGIALELKPDVVTLVPEKRNEMTTEGGIDLTVYKDEIGAAIQTLQLNGIRVSVFIDPDPDQVKIAHKINTNIVEIHTGALCETKSIVHQSKCLSKIVDAIKLAHKLNLNVHAGHGLCYQTIKLFEGLHEIDEFSIGHSIISRAIMVGMHTAVKEMLDMIYSL